MICIYDVGENHYDRLGSCVLTPIKGSHRQIAGGSYELTLEHPIDAGGKWAHLQNGAILKVPVPEETIEDAREGMAADIYRTVAEAELREEPSEPQQINYNAWNPQTSYTVGSKVTCSGWNHRNWQCTFYDASSPQTYVPPYNNNTWWKQIADYTSGSPVIVKLPAGETLYLVEAGEGWYQVITPYGVQGYIKADKVEFVKHVEPGEITSHVITEQLFRITEVDIDNEANKVTAKARHVSYDLNGILCEDMEISQASAAMAISRIAQGLMMEYPGAIATNLTDTAGTYTQSIKGRNGGFCLLDPDRGVLPAFGAMLKRDNWDVFIMKKKHTDRGYRIRYGKNAKGINWQRKVQDLVTRVVPVAKNEDGSNLYLPEKWVDSTHISEYPTVIMEWLRVDGQVGKDDGTGTDTVWTLENLYTEMRTKAGERFTVDKVDIPAEEVTVNFEQLGDTAEYPWMRERETILLYDKIQAIDERIGLRMDLYVTEIEYDVIRQKVTGVKLSNTDSYRERTVTGFNVQDNSITPRKLTDEVKDSFMASAVGVMPNYANSNTWKPNTASSEGYVQKGEGNANKVWATNGDGEPAWRTPGGYTLPLAADGTRGGVQIGYTQSGKNYPVQLSGEKMFVNVPWTDHYAWDDITGKPSSFYTLPLAANGTRGGVQVGFSTSAANRNYAVQLSGEKMYVNVPWTDHYAWADITGKPNLSGAAGGTDLTLITTNDRYNYNFAFMTAMNFEQVIPPIYSSNGTVYHPAFKTGDYVYIEPGVLGESSGAIKVAKYDKALNAAVTASDFKARPSASSYTPFVINELRQKDQTIIGGDKNGLAIYSNGNTHPPIDAGEYVYVENHGSLANGFYCAEGGIIMTDEALTSSNVVAAGEKGALNKMQYDIYNYIGYVRDDLSVKFDTYSFGYITVSAFESGLVDFGGNLENSDIRKIYVIISTASGIFQAVTYIGTIARTADNRYAVHLRRATSNDEIVGFYDGSSWTWDSLALNRKLKFGAWTNVTLPLNVSSDGFLSVFLNPSTTAGAYCRLASGGGNPSITAVATTGEPVTVIAPIKNNDYIYQRMLTNGTISCRFMPIFQ